VSSGNQKYIVHKRDLLEVAKEVHTVLTNVGWGPLADELWWYVNAEKATRGKPDESV
jgi:hypothetical protein